MNNTPQPLSEERIAEIRERAEKATAGPWEADASTSGVYSRGVAWIAEVSLDEDREFVTHAHEDIPALLAEVERLKVQNAAMRTSIDEMIAFIQEARAAARPQRFSETADNILIRAINAGRAAQAEHAESEGAE